MKHYIFLLLLFFAFSTSDDFEIIKEPGIQLWEISDDSNEISKYERFDLPNKASLSSNVDSSEESYLRIQDSGVSELDIVQQRMNTHNTFTEERMDTHNTYIIVEMNEYDNLSIYYWVGAQSSEKKRINGAHLAGDIFMKMVKEIRRKYLKRFHREAEGRESVSFLILLNKFSGRIAQRLYRVAGTKGQFIVEVPVTPSQLNGSDSFIVHKRHTAYVWNSYHSNPYIRCRANTLGIHIVNMERKKHDRQSKPSTLITEGYTDQNSNFYKSFEKEFFRNMNANEEEKKFPQTPYHYTDEELGKKRREDLKLYTFSNIPQDFTPYQVSYKDLKLNDLDEKVAYVLADLICGNTYVIIGHRNGLISVKKSLSFAETFYRSIKVEDAWQRVKIIRLGNELPLYFQIYFSDSSTWEVLKFVEE